jgi:hypothetical protein
LPHRPPHLAAHRKFGTISLQESLRGIGPLPLPTGKFARPGCPMRFVDLFAGLGGFHVALKRLGHRCVFASEIDPGLCDLYKKNFGLEAKSDIREVPLTQTCRV